MPLDFDPAPQVSPLRRRRAGRERLARLDLGAVVRNTFAIYARHFPLLLLLSTVVRLPGALFRYAALEPAYAKWSSWRDAGLHIRQDLWDFLDAEVGWVVLVLEGALGTCLQALVAYTVFQALRRQPVRYGRSLVLGVKRSPPALVAALLMTIVAFLPLALAVAFGMATRSAAIGLLLGLGGLIWLVVALCALYVSVPAAVVEGGNPFRALARSASLTRGARGSVFAALFVVGGLVFVTSKVLQHGFEYDEPATLDMAYRGLWLVASADLLLAALPAVLASVLYHDLRLSKEGVGVDELVRVFE